MWENILSTTFFAMIYFVLKSSVKLFTNFAELYKQLCSQSPNVKSNNTHSCTVPRSTIYVDNKYCQSYSISTTEEVLNV